MSAKEQVLAINPQIHLYAETLNPRTQSRLLILDENDKVLAWNWGVPGVAGYEDPIWEEALEYLNER